MKWLQFILSHSIFISICAIALCYQTFLLLHIAPDYYIYGLVFFATLSSYNFYWLISKFYFSRNIPIGNFLIKHFSNTLLFLFAAAGLFYCMLHLLDCIPYIVIAVVLTIMYSIPLWPLKSLEFTRRAGFLKTVLLAFTWAYVTVIIPARHLFFTDNLSVLLLFSARFLFMLMLCIIFDSRDIQVDKMHSLRSLATDVSRATLKIIMAVVFLLYLICGLFLRYYFNDIPQIIAFIVTGTLTLFVYLASLKKQDYFFYYFLVDGLMLFSALTSFMATI